MNEFDPVYEVDRDYSIEEVFYGIRSVSVTGYNPERRSLCIFAEGTYPDKSFIQSYGNQNKYRYKIYYIPLPQWYNPMMGFVFLPEELNRIKIRRTVVYSRENPKDRVCSFYKAIVNVRGLNEIMK